MTINSWSYLKEFESEKNDILSAVTTVFESGVLILGDKVKQFELDFATYCGVNYGVGVNSATDALFLSLKALEIGEGDEVITVSNTAVPTVASIVAAGAIPVFVDINPHTFLMDVSKVEDLINPKTKCILPVHLFGQCVDMDALNVLAKKHRLFVIEDCSQAHGALYKGSKSGSLSTISVFSFYPTKILGAYGDAGIILCSDEILYHKLKALRNYGMNEFKESIFDGYNSRLDELQAAILLSKLPKIESYINRRIEIANLYAENLKLSGLVLPFCEPFNRHAYYLYVVKHPRRNELINYLKGHDIHVSISYPMPIHLMNAYRKLGYLDGSLPNTEKVATQLFSLPIFPSLTNEEVLYICETINNFK